MKKSPDFELKEKCYACRQEFNRFKGHFRVSIIHPPGNVCMYEVFNLFFAGSSTTVATVVRVCVLSARGKELHCLSMALICLQESVIFATRSLTPELSRVLDLMPRPLPQAARTSLQSTCVAH